MLAILLVTNECLRKPPLRRGFSFLHKYLGLLYFIWLVFMSSYDPRLHSHKTLVLELAPRVIAGHNLMIFHNNGRRRYAHMPCRGPTCWSLVWLVLVWLAGRNYSIACADLNVWERNHEGSGIKVHECAGGRALIKKCIKTIDNLERLCGLNGCAKLHREDLHRWLANGENNPPF